MAKKVMVVDDEPDITNIMETLLKKNGFEVFSANSGTECIESIKDFNPEVLFMDVMMPDMNGWEVIRELKKRGILGNIKIIMLTVVKQPDEKHADLSPYILDYIRKPFGKDDLLKRVNRLTDL